MFCFQHQTPFEGRAGRPRSAGPISWVLFAIQQSNLRLFYEALCAPCHTNNNKTSALAQSLHFVCMTHSHKQSQTQQLWELWAICLLARLFRPLSWISPLAALHSVEMKSPVHSYSLSEELKAENKFPRHHKATHFPAKRTQSQINCKKVSGNTFTISRTQK